MDIQELNYLASGISSLDEVKTVLSVVYVKTTEDNTVAKVKVVYPCRVFDCDVRCNKQEDVAFKDKLIKDIVESLRSEDCIFKLPVAANDLDISRNDEFFLTITILDFVLNNCSKYFINLGKVIDVQRMQDEEIFKDFDELTFKVLRDKSYLVKTQCLGEDM